MNRLAALLLVAVLALSACSGRGSTSIATVNGVEISRDEFYAQLADIKHDELLTGAFGTQDSSSTTGTVSTVAASTYLNLVVTRILVTQLLDRHHLDVTKADRAAVVAELAKGIGNGDATAGQAALAQADQSSVARVVDFFAPVFAANRLAPTETPVKVTEAQIRDAYEQSLAQFAEVCVHHILIGNQTHNRDEASALAAKAKARIDAGEKFAAVAKDLSEDTGSADKGGDLGCRKAGEYSQSSAAFAQAVVDAPVGKVTAPIETEFGFHVVLVDSRTTTPFVEVRDQLRQQLTDLAESDAQQVQSAAARKIIDRARVAADVEVDPRVGLWTPLALDAATGQLAPVPARRATTYAIVPPKGPIAAPTTTLPLSLGSGAPTGGQTSTTVPG